MAVVQNGKLVLVTGASGNAGRRICSDLVRAGFPVRMADVAPPSRLSEEATFVRCDTRTSSDAREAVEGVDVVVHLAAWHSAHRPRVSEATIFAVNVDGTFNVLQACKEFGVKSFVFASSMAYGWHSTYAVTKVVGEELCKYFREATGASVAILRYNEFIPRPYLEFGAHLLTNGVDRGDVSSATTAAVVATIERRVDLFRTVVHNANKFPDRVIENFASLGPDWCEEKVSGAKRLIEKYKIPLPEKIDEVHDLSEAERMLGWKPKVGFIEFLGDLKERDARGEDVSKLFMPSELHSQGLTFI